jgi:hypothetical protein
MKALLSIFLFSAAALAFATSASALTTAMVDVAAVDDIYNAGHPSPPYDGGVPPSVSFAAGPSNSVTVLTPSTETITLNSGGNYNDPDGVGAAVSTSSNTGGDGISGITAPNAGYLVGVFENGTEPSAPGPAALDFTSIGTDFTTLSPLLNQTFFIGDGLTGDGTGTIQQFIAPAGATELFLGISDAGGYNGSPGAYDDNSGTFSAVVNIVPEPSSLALVALGATAFAAWRRKQSRS